MKNCLLPVPPSETNRSGDHIGCVSDVEQLKASYPQGISRYDPIDTLNQMFDELKNR